MTAEEKAAFVDKMKKSKEAKSIERLKILNGEIPKSVPKIETKVEEPKTEAPIQINYKILTKDQLIQVGTKMGKNLSSKLKKDQLI